MGRLCMAVAFHQLMRLVPNKLLALSRKWNEEVEELEDLAAHSWRCHREEKVSNDCGAVNGLAPSENLGLIATFKENEEENLAQTFASSERLCIVYALFNFIVHC
ncbi:unnamed protein product [Gongylonema pulchrum]|uniref:PDEase domain-containing protein n=1 Tax=Gongylonema pulchrum TaxID=637853 RepID=A0A183EC73_9BILA|nr:unnamed protein product [Gongylonema pulchrum]